MVIYAMRIDVIQASNQAKKSDCCMMQFVLMQTKIL